MKRTARLISLIMVLALLCCSLAAFAEQTPELNNESAPAGEIGEGETFGATAQPAIAEEALARLEGRRRTSPLPRPIFVPGASLPDALPAVD